MFLFVSSVYLFAKIVIVTECLCICFISFFYFSICTVEYCPFGKSWLSPPIANDSRNRVQVACSNMVIKTMTHLCSICSFDALCRNDGYIYCVVFVVCRDYVII